MANFTIYKGESRVLPFKVDDLPDLNNFKAIFVVSNDIYGTPIDSLTKTETSGITINAVSRDVDVNIAVSDFGYSGGISDFNTGTYHYQLFLIKDDGVNPVIPRLFKFGTITLLTGVPYKYPAS